MIAVKTFNCICFHSSALELNVYCLYGLKSAMQRPKRPGRYGDDHVWECLSSSGSQSTEISRPYRLRENFENRFDPRDGKKLFRYSPRSRRNIDGGGPPWMARSFYQVPGSASSLSQLGEGVMFKADQMQPPRPGPPPPPAPRVQPTTPGPSTGSSAEKKNEVMSRLLSVLECPVCFEYVSPPILQCQEGHLVCSGCRSRLELCPKCRQPFSDIRARALEQVAEVVPYPCYNAGCSALLPLSEREAHEGVCPYRQYPCTIGLCLWIGKRSTLLQHVTEDHPDILINSATHELLLTLTQHVNEEKVFLMQCYEELFHCVMGVDCQQDIFVGFVMLLGPREKASDYEFELKFKREGSPYTSVSITRTTLEESTSSGPVGINGGINAVVVSFSTLREVIQDSSAAPLLPVYIYIRKRLTPEAKPLRLDLDHPPQPLPE